MDWQFFAMAIDPQDSNSLINANAYNPPLPVVSFEAIGPDGTEYEDITPADFPAFLESVL